MHPLLVEGLTDAIGFVAGALIAYGVSLLLGFSPLTPGFGDGAIIGMLLAGLGGGAGLHLARRWRASRDKNKE
jgi:hypothetical protein